MYRFQINAYTQIGESIGIVGSTPELGHWQVTKCILLRTNSERYPLWWTEENIDIQPCLNTVDSQRIEYKYVRLSSDGTRQFEALGLNRWIPVQHEDASAVIVIDDGEFNYAQSHPFGYLEETSTKQNLSQGSENLKILVLGSSVALGYKAWMFRGWSWLLGQSLRLKFGHQVVNASEVGANASRTIARFPSVVAREQPDIVIVSLSLGNEGLAHCAPHQRKSVQRRFEAGLQQLVKMTRDLGALPILGSVYPHNDYCAEHYSLLLDTHNRMLNSNEMVLDWLSAVDDGQGRWREGTSFDPSHPNLIGHQLMYQAIDLNFFEINNIEFKKDTYCSLKTKEVLVYADKVGFQVTAKPEENKLIISNLSSYSYTISPYWQELQTALQRKAGLKPGIYLTSQTQQSNVAFFAVNEDSHIETNVNIPPNSRFEFASTLNHIALNNPQLIFYDGHLGILKENGSCLCIFNESDNEYNIQPMWQEVRCALKTMQSGVYEDLLNPDTPFRTLMISTDGLESRVKVPSRSAVWLQYKCALQDLQRIAIVPLGDRCAVRMLLYKMGFDGPAYPFDLTRTTKIGDVADIIEEQFFDMWNPTYLHYDSDAGRLYHRKWTGLSFAHEVEETDDTYCNMSAVYERMRVRYSARSERFLYTLQYCDRAIFIRTGIADFEGVKDLAHKLHKKFQGKPFILLLLSPQLSDEFLKLPNVVHYNLDFNPDLMYQDLEYWMSCTERLRGILESLGVSTKNLFWCPPNPPKREAIASINFENTELQLAL
ncbi:DUF1796 family putative cysteine peptidase [Altericista sp. CCNU0014]|uniref:DUF1796 family putative cysteine peptidase n=1 Tax=Altericista sp. CCNU0014 TaxID=3082949 RepID=UPI00385072B6